MDGSSPSTSSPDPKDNSPAARRYYNDAVMALDDLYAAAVRSDGALDSLRDIADKLFTRAGKWSLLQAQKTEE